jgi:hypothetical protein
MVVVLEVEAPQEVPARGEDETQISRNLNTDRIKGGREMKKILIITICIFISVSLILFFSSGAMARRGGGGHSGGGHSIGGHHGGYGHSYGGYGYGYRGYYRGYGWGYYPWGRPLYPSYGGMCWTPGYWGYDPFTGERVWIPERRVPCY